MFSKMFSARFSTATQATTWRTGRRRDSSPLTALAPSGARAFSAAWSWIGNAGGTASTPRAAETTAAVKLNSASGEAIASRPSPPTPCSWTARAVTPLRRPKGRRGFGCSSAAGRGPAFCGEGAVVSDTGTGGNSGIGRGGGGRRSASTNVVSSSISSSAETKGSGSRDFAAVKDGTETHLVAARRLEAGRVVFDRVGGSLSDRSTRHSVQVREGLHLDAEGDLIFLNHSCDPNCQLEVVEPAELDTPVGEETKEHPYLRVTVRAPEIPQNQLLTIDYNAMEIDMSSPFDCLCGADNCRGRVSGFANLPPAAQQEYTSASAAGAAASTPASASASAARKVGESPAVAPPPLTGAVRTWAKENKLAGAQ